MQLHIPVDKSSKNVKEKDYAQSYQRKEQKYGIFSQCRTARRNGTFGGAE